MGKRPTSHADSRSKSRRTLTMRVGAICLLGAAVVYASRATPLPAADLAPKLVATYPLHGAEQVSPPETLTLTFSEPVNLATGAVALDCAKSGAIDLATSSGPTSFTFTLDHAVAIDDDCVITVFAGKVTDQDTSDPPDQLTADSYVKFHTVLPTAQDVIINEIDAVSADDGHEFLELYDGGTGNTALDGLKLVFYNGATDTAYSSVSLTGRSTSSDGYFLLSSDPATADLLLGGGFFLDGPAAAALYDAPDTTFPYGSPVSVTDLTDAVVYDNGQPDDAGLLVLLEAGQPQLDEAANGTATTKSNQRCPNGQGRPRQTSDYRLGQPTPRAGNACPHDDPPTLADASPHAGESVPADSLQLSLTFSEPVHLAGNAVELVCETSGEHVLAITGGPVTFTATPQTTPAGKDTCVVTVFGTLVSDLDDDDPPDNLVADSKWTFATISEANTDILINEVDTNSPGSDTAEFIELYDGGLGQESLDGLTLVLFNGGTGTSYQAIGLDGYATDASGYFVVGSAAVSDADLNVGNGLIQNGPDAIALYAAAPSSFPNGSPVTTAALVDALVYGSGSNAALQALLNPGQPVVDENGNGAAETQSMQRCPNGSGGQHNTDTVQLGAPTPDQLNVCPSDTAPQLTSFSPADNETGVVPSATLYLSFSEPVQLSPGAVALDCGSGAHPLAVTGGPTDFIVEPNVALPPNATCQALVAADGVSDLDTADPPDAMPEDVDWQFETARQSSAAFLINEFDVDTAGTDRAEFIEIYDGGLGNQPLDGLVVVLFNGQGDLSYRTIDLAGQQTNAAGYLVLGGPDVPSAAVGMPAGALQNGPDAIALYRAKSSVFPNGSAVTLTDLVDAVVYGTADPNDAGLLGLLLPSQPQIDESSRGLTDDDSNQRCGVPSVARETADFLQNHPTAGAANDCLVDTAPQVVVVQPDDGASGVTLEANLSVEFSEPVTTSAGWLQLDCNQSGIQTLTTVGGPVTYTATPTSPLPAGERCEATILADSIHDLDAVDPPDTLANDFAWQFETLQQSSAGFLINEFDVDTAGTDRAEFIEIYDGGLGNQPLDGLVVVLFNGQSDLSYRTIDLAGQQTNAAGYLLLGGPDVSNAAVDLPVGALQNGPDAIALYRAKPSQFPNGSAVTLTDLADAVVYGTADPNDAGLLALLLPGQPQIDENSRGLADVDSNQRCGEGDVARETAGFLQNHPTPGAANDCLVDNAPQVVAVQPDDGAVGIATGASLAVEFSEPVAASAGWLQLDCDKGGAQALTIGGGPVTYTATPTSPLSAGERCETTILANNVHDLDAVDPPDVLPTNFTWEFTVEPSVCLVDHTPIEAIQGPGAASPMQGQPATTMGIVTADFLADLGALTIQTPDDAADADPHTSPGLMVFLASGKPVPAVGNRVIVTGLVVEADQRTALSDAEVTAVCEQGAAVAPLALATPPATAAEWERLESLLVAPSTATIIGNSELATSGELVVSWAARPTYPTETQPPGPTAQAQLAANRAALWIIDDGRINLDPQTTLPTPGEPMRSGDTVAPFVGIVDGYAGGRRIHALEPVAATTSNPRPAPLTASTGGLRVASVDLGVYANGDGQGGSFTMSGGANSWAEYLRQRTKVVALIRALAADIVTINGFEPDGYAANSAIQDLLTVLNATLPEAPYQLATPVGSTSEQFAQQSAVFYRPDRVTAVGAEAPEFAGGHVARPLMVRFQEPSTGEGFAIFLLHLDPRDDCPTSGPNADQLDGQSCNNPARTQAVEAIATWLGDQDERDRTLILGNWNAFGREDPLSAAVAAGFIDLTPAPPSGYTVLVDGHLGATHRALAGEHVSSLVNQVTTWPVNADEATAFDFRLDNPPDLYAPDPYRAASADPVIIDLNIGELRADFSTNAPVLVGETMHFQSLAAGTGTLAHTWDFGDSSMPGHEQHPSHQYAHIGTYVVKLTVTDDRGSQSATHIVDVLPRRMYLPVGLSAD